MRRTGYWLASTASEKIVSRVMDILGTQKVTLPEVLSELSTETKEIVSENFGGLLKFLKDRPATFDVTRGPNGIFCVERKRGRGSGSTAWVPRAPAAIAADTKASPQPTAVDNYSRRTFPRHSLPRFGRVSFKYGPGFHTLPRFAVPLTAVAQAIGAGTNVVGVVAALKPAMETGAVLLAKGSPNGDDANIIYVVPLNGAGDERNNRYEDYSVPLYDVCRIARFMSCDESTSLGHLTELGGAILTKPIAQVLMSVPERFACEFGDSGWDEVLSADTEHILESREAPHTTPSPSPSSSTDLTVRGVNEAKVLAALASITPHVKILLRATYMADPANINKHAPLALMFENHSLEELHDEMAAYNSRGDKGTFKAVKFRRKLIQATIAKRFPNGNPLIDPDVTAHYLYDRLERHSGYLSATAVREMLPEVGKTACQTGNEFFKGFPNLFNVMEKSTTDLFVQRADCGPAIPNRPLEAPEIALLVATAIPMPIDPERFMSVSLLTSRLTTHTNNEVKRLFGSLDGFLKLFPYIFDLSTTADKASVTFRTNADKLASWEAMAMKKINSHGPEHPLAPPGGKPQR